MKENGHRMAKSVHQAMNLLNEAVHYKKEDAYLMMRKQADDASHYVDIFAEHIKKWIYQAESKTEEALRSGETIISKNSEEAFKTVEKKIMKHPWKTMGLVALTAFIIGYSLPPDEEKD